MATFKINLQGQEAEVEVTRQGDNFRVSHHGQSYDLLLLKQEGPIFVLEELGGDGQRKLIRAAGESRGDQRQMWVNGHNFSFTRVRQRGSAATVDGSLSSSIPAVVSKLLVETGDKVSEGDKLILLESMKMIIPIQSPKEGIIKAIHCHEGESVEAGRPLIELE